MGLRVSRRSLVPRILAAVLTAGACLASAAWAPPPGEDAPRAAFFGSSTVAGVGATSPERRWSTRVARTLGWREVNLGLTGSKLTAVPARIRSGQDRVDQVIAQAPDVVVVMYGANDVVAGVPLGDAATARTFHHAVADVLGRLRSALPGATLVVCSPQPTAALARSRRPYDEVLATAAARVGAIYVPAGEAFTADRLPALARDRIHLNDRGHRALATFVAERLAADVGARSVRGAELALGSREPWGAPSP